MISITIAGNLGADAELRMTQGGQAVLNLRVAVKDSKGTTEWFRCSLWGKRGEAVAQYLRKGTKVTIVGSLAFTEYNGQRQYEVSVNEIDFINSDRAPQQQAQQRPADRRRDGSVRRQAAPPQQQPQDDFDYSNGLGGSDEIPF